MTGFNTRSYPVWVKFSERRRTWRCVRPLPTQPKGGLSVAAQRQRLDWSKKSTTAPLNPLVTWNTYFEENTKKIPKKRIRWELSVPRQERRVFLISLLWFKWMNLMYAIHSKFISFFILGSLSITDLHISSLTAFHTKGTPSVPKTANCTELVPKTATSTEYWTSTYLPTP